MAQFTERRWQYSGDINIEHGGLYWRLPTTDNFPEADYVEAVEVIPCSDMGGPSCQFLIQVGSIYIDRATYATALACCGYEAFQHARRGAPWRIASGRAGQADSVRMDSVQGACMLVDAFRAYRGLDDPTTHRVQIGKPDAYLDDLDDIPEPDIQLRGNTDLRRYVRREFLGLAG